MLLSPRRPGNATRKKTRERNRRDPAATAAEILDRIENRPGPERDQPMITATNIHYELGRARPRPRPPAASAPCSCWLAAPA